MNMFLPREVFLTGGIGIHKYRLSSFESALRDAGVANQNIVPVSSILPPGCKIVSKRDGIAQLRPGNVRYAVMARIDTNENQRLIAASIGLAQPKDTNKWGYISEVHEHGLTAKESGNVAEDLAASMLGTTLGIELNPDIAWVERESAYKSSGLIVKATSITQSVTGQKGLWTTAVAMAVFIL